MSEQIDVLAVMDTVARGCALHADKCVGEVGERWAKVATVDYDEARAAVAEVIAERDRLRMELAWNLPVVWVLRTDDPDPQYDFAVGRECPAGWKGKASPLYDGQGMRPINWQAAVAELVDAATEVRDAAWGPGKTDQPRIIRLDAALARVQGGAP